MITFKQTKTSVDVYLEGKFVGSIVCGCTGYQYFPKGKATGGEVFVTLKECKMSLIEG